MRIVGAILLAILLGVGLWVLLLDPGLDERSDAAREGAGATPEPTVDAVGGTHRARLKSGTLVLRVRTPEGTVPEGAEAGYSYAGRMRWSSVDDRGWKSFTDAPLGAYEVRARAPGYEEAGRPCRLLAGVAEEIVLLLRPAVESSGR